MGSAQPGLTAGGVVLGNQQAGQEGFEADHFLVASGQGSDGDECLAEMSEGLASGELVEGLVGERDAASGKAGQDGGDGRLGQPAHRCDGVLGGGDIAAEGLQPRWQERVGGPISSSRRLLMRQRAQWPGLGWPGSLQVGQSAQAGGGVQAAQSGSARVPEVIAARRPQAVQAAERRWQAGHHGRPVTRERPHGVVSLQIEQVRIGSERQREHSGPSPARRSRTVGYHLHKAYRKLGVTSASQLRDTSRTDRTVHAERGRAVTSAATYS